MKGKRGLGLDALGARVAQPRNLATVFSLVCTWGPKEITTHYYPILMIVTIPGPRGPRNLSLGFLPQL